MLQSELVRLLRGNPKIITAYEKLQLSQIESLLAKIFKIKQINAISKIAL